VEDDLRAVASGTEASMRLALLGPVSPLGLAWAVRQGRGLEAALHHCRRLPTRRDFQGFAGGWPALSEPERRSLFEKHAGTAHAQLSALFDELRAEHPEELGTMTAFQRYARAVQPDLERRS
jgi:hypothetical protein